MGHLTVTESTFEALPSPKWAGSMFCPMELAPAETSLTCCTSPVATVIRAPMPSRLLAAPTVSIISQLLPHLQEFSNSLALSSRLAM